MRSTACCHRDLSIGQNAHGDALEGSEPCPFDVICDADAEISSFRASLTLADGKMLIVGARKCLLLAFRKISAVIHERLSIAKHQSEGIAHLLGADHIASTQFGAINCEFACHPIH